MLLPYALTGVVTTPLMMEAIVLDDQRWNREGEEEERDVQLACLKLDGKA